MLLFDPNVTGMINKCRERIVYLRLKGRIDEMRVVEAEMESLEYRMLVRAEARRDVEPITDKAMLARIAERCLYGFYSAYVFDPPHYPCDCKWAMPSCDCYRRFRPTIVPPLQPPKWTVPKRPLVKRSLYSEREQRWWQSEKPRNETDPNIRAQEGVAGEGMRGRWAGGKGGRGAWHAEPNAYENSQQEDTPLWKRDREATAREGERALNKPYDDPRGTPKSWSNPRDAEPDNEDGIRRLGKRVIEDSVIAPPTGDEDD